jgi:hypothetical protein
MASPGKLFFPIGSIYKLSRAPSNYLSVGYVRSYRSKPCASDMEWMAAANAKSRMVHNHPIFVYPPVHGCRLVCRSCYTKWVTMVSDNDVPRCPWCRQACPVCKQDASPDWIIMAMLANTPAECVLCHEIGTIGALRDGHTCLTLRSELSLFPFVGQRKVSGCDADSCNNHTDGCNARICLVVVYCLSYVHCNRSNGWMRTCRVRASVCAAGYAAVSGPRKCWRCCNRTPVVHRRVCGRVSSPLYWISWVQHWTIPVTHSFRSSRAGQHRWY